MCVSSEILLGMSILMRKEGERGFFSKQLKRSIRSMQNTAKHIMCLFYYYFSCDTKENEQTSNITIQGHKIKVMQIID